MIFRQLPWLLRDHTTRWLDAGRAQARFLPAKGRRQSGSGGSAVHKARPICRREHFPTEQRPPRAGCGFRRFSRRSFEVVIAAAAG
jgi:hypothetical protein